MEAAIGVMCSSMPAMASFSKLYIFQTSPFTSLRSRLLWHKSSERIKDAKTPPDALNKKRPNAAAKSSGDKFLAGSFAPLRDDRHHVHYREDVAYPRWTTQTSVQVGSEPSRKDLEIGRIEKSVTIEQSSHEATESPFPWACCHNAKRR